MRSTRPQLKSFWQGLLVIVPALLLGAVGLGSLRQDRILAQHEATEQAQALAPLIQKRLSDALQAPVWHQSFPLRANSEIPPPHSQAPFWITTLSGTLVYPPPKTGFPTPSPVNLSALEDQQRALWTAARQAGMAQSQPALAFDLYRQFLQSKPPDRFAALAEFESAIILRNLQQPQEAQNRFFSLARKWPEILTESGLSLPMLARWHGIQQLTNPQEDPRELDLLWRQIATNPNPVSDLLAQQLEPVTAAISLPWQEAWKKHEDWRLMVERIYPAISNMTNQLGLAWVELRTPPVPYLLVSQVRQGQRWTHAISERELIGETAAVLEEIRLPEYLGANVELAGRALLQSDPDAQLLSELDGTINDPAIPLAILIHLANPAALFAQQRVRTIWTGTLILVALAAVVAGFLANWRALQRQHQLAAMKSSFVSSVSHELRAPIASIRLMTEELMDIGLVDREKSRGYHRFIAQECRRLSALIDNVLDFSRIEQGRKHFDFEPTQLDALVCETVRLMEPYALDRQVHLTTKVSSAFEELHPCVDGHAIQQVLVNLIDNAIKHSPPHAEIEIGLDLQHSSERGSMPAFCFWVRDHGEGIPEAEHDRIFERFYRCGSELRRETQGVGLGLAIVKFIVEAHGGQIRIESELGQGTCFMIELPCRGHSSVMSMRADETAL